MLRSILKIRTLGRALVASLAIVALLAATPAQAAAVQFAQFDQTQANQPFSFTNNGGTSGTVAYNSATTVSFNFTSLTGLSTVDRTGTLTLSGAPTFTPGFSLGGGFVDQPLSSPLTLKITEIGGPNPGANLLTMFFTGDITGRGPVGSISGADTTGQVVTYSSDLLTFSQPGNSFVLGLDTINPGLSLGAGNFLNNFIANASGQFTANFNAVPAPSSVVMYGTGMAATLVVAHRVRRKRLARIARS
jgi:hypothetical protein